MGPLVYMGMEWDGMEFLEEHSFAFDVTAEHHAMCYQIFAGVQHWIYRWWYGLSLQTGCLQQIRLHRQHR